MIHAGPLPVRVREARPLSPTLRHFVLEHAAGGALPLAPPGAHVLLTLETPTRLRRNAYSLVATGARYEIVVRQVAASRGGSEFLHTAARPGHILAMGLPRNLFPVSPLARRHLLLAAGIGVTPFLSYLRALGPACELHQFCRPADVPAFAALLARWPERTHLHTHRAALDLPGLLAAQDLGTHLYTCGPEPFMADVADIARRLGWPAAKLHRESFGHASGGDPFSVTLARSGQSIAVDADSTLLEALESAGIDAPCLCRGGVCGQCRVALLDGEPEHRDMVLSAEERAAGDCIMTCVSRGRTPLVLDL